jgi:phenylalanyl-tRNA synthetase beta chain
MQPLLIHLVMKIISCKIVATQLNSQGFNEMMANSLTTATYVQLSTMLKEEHNVTMLNPLSNDLSTLRQSLLFSGLEAIFII